MRFVISVLFAIIINYTAYTQGLPNYDFEEWETSEGFNNPKYWGTSNYSVFSVVSFNPVNQETDDVYSGNSSVKLETVGKVIDSELVKVAGLITLGTFEVNLSTREAIVKGGIPYTYHPTKFSGYYKYSTPEVDSCSMGIYLTKYNSSQNKRDTVGQGVFTSGATDDWENFETDINYFSSEPPDSMNIVILSSDTSLFVEGSTLLIDNLFIDEPVSINDYNHDDLESKIFIYPNPAKEFIYIDLADNKLENCSVKLIDLNGRIVIESVLRSNNNKIDVSHLSPGIYFIEIYDGLQKFLESIIIN